MIAVHGGDYYRLLPPGQYKVTVYRDGYLPKSKHVTVEDNPYQPAKRIDFALKPLKVRS